MALPELLDTLNDAVLRHHSVTARANGFVFEAIFDDDYFSAEVADATIESREPFIVCRTRDVARVGLRKGVSIEIAGTTYRVERVEPDSGGMSRIVLRV